MTTLWLAISSLSSATLTSLRASRAVQGNKSAAARYAANVLPVIREIQASGIKSLRGVAQTARGIATARGGAERSQRPDFSVRRSRFAAP